MIFIAIFSVFFCLGRRRVLHMNHEAQECGKELPFFCSIFCSYFVDHEDNKNGTERNAAKET